MRAAREMANRRVLRTAGAVTVDELATGLAVSASTIRRDLERLERAGILSRVHGGAAQPSAAAADHDSPFAEVALGASEAKQAIAHRCVDLVGHGDVVVLDIGTSTRRVARLVRRRAVTVVTASLANVDELRDDRQVSLVLLGGTFRPDHQSCVGTLTEDAMRQIHADSAFLRASGITADPGTLRELNRLGVEVATT